MNVPHRIVVAVLFICTCRVKYYRWYNFCIEKTLSIVTVTSFYRVQVVVHNFTNFESAILLFFVIIKI
jgi:hypothetical protein